MLNIFIQAFLYFFWHIFKFSDESSFLQVLHFFLDLLQRFRISLQSFYHSSVLFISGHSVALHGIDVEGFERKRASEEPRIAIFSLYELYQLFHCLLLDEVVIRGGIDLSYVTACSTFGTFITLYHHVDIIPVDATFTYIYNSFHCFLS